MSLGQAVLKIALLSVEYLGSCTENSPNVRLHPLVTFSNSADRLMAHTHPFSRHLRISYVLLLSATHRPPIRMLLR